MIKEYIDERYYYGVFLGVEEYVDLVFFVFYVMLVVVVKVVYVN